MALHVVARSTSLPTSCPEEQRAEEARAVCLAAGQRLACSLGVLFHLPRNRPCWLERNPTLKGTRRDPCPGPLGCPPLKVLGLDCRWNRLISECPEGAGSSLLNRQSSCGRPLCGHHETQVGV